MADNNPTLRATIARQAAGIFGFQFTSTFEIGGRTPANNAMLTELSDSDKLEIAGVDIIRAQSVMVLAADLLGVNIKALIGTAVVLDGDPSWQVKNFHLSPDGALYTFLLIDAQ
jgi:hypothetical protein